MAAATALCALRCWSGAPGRPAWIALTVALALWGLGNAYWNIVLYHDPNPPFPSPADAGWLAFYPAAYVALGLHLRSSVRGLPASMWLDGLIGVLAVAALGMAFVVAPILDGAEGSTAELVTNAANPIGDLLLASRGHLLHRAQPAGHRPGVAAAGRRPVRLHRRRRDLPVPARERLLRARRRARLDVARRRGADGRGRVAAAVAAADRPPRRLAHAVGELPRLPRGDRAPRRGGGRPRVARRGVPGGRRAARRDGPDDDAGPRAAPVRRDPSPGHHGRADRAPQPPLVRPAPAQQDRAGPGDGRHPGAAGHRPRPLQGAQRHPRPPRRRPCARSARSPHRLRAARRRRRRAPRRRRVRGAARRRPPGGAGRRADRRRARRALHRGGHRAAGRGQHRRGAVPRARARRRDAAPARRRRDVPGEVGPHRHRVLRAASATSTPASGCS